MTRKEREYLCERVLVTRDKVISQIALLLSTDLPNKEGRLKALFKLDLELREEWEEHYNVLYKQKLS